MDLTSSFRYFRIYDSEKLWIYRKKGFTMNQFPLWHRPQNAFMIQAFTIELVYVFSILLTDDKYLR